MSSIKSNLACLLGVVKFGVPSMSLKVSRPLFALLNDRCFHRGLGGVCTTGSHFSVETDEVQTDLSSWSTRIWSWDGSVLGVE